MSSMTMNATPTNRPPKKRKASKTPDGSREAKQIAAAILEVFAGVRTPTDAAHALGVSVPRYYTLELRALEGLVGACEPRSKGPQRSPEREIERLQREIKRLEQETSRSQALARATQRTVGLFAPRVEKKPTSGKKRRKRKPTVRALKLAAGLQSDSGPSMAPNTDVPPSQ